MGLDALENETVPALRREIRALRHDLYSLIEILRDCGAIGRYDQMNTGYRSKMNEILDRLQKDFVF